MSPGALLHLPLHIQTKTEASCDTNMSHHTNRKWVLWGSESSLGKEPVRQSPTDSLKMTDTEGKKGVMETKKQKPAFLPSLDSDLHLQSHTP